VGQLIPVKVSPTQVNGAAGATQPAATAISIEIW